MRVSEIRVKRIRVNQGLGVLRIYNFERPTNVKIIVKKGRKMKQLVHLLDY